MKLRPAVHTPLLQSIALKPILLQGPFCPHLCTRCSSFTYRLSATEVSSLTIVGRA